MLEFAAISDEEMSMAKVLGIGGVFFKSPDPAKLSEWYVQHLGMNLAPYGGVKFTADMLPPGGSTTWKPFKASTANTASAMFGM